MARVAGQKEAGDIGRDTAGMDPAIEDAFIAWRSESENRVVESVPARMADSLAHNSHRNTAHSWAGGCIRVEAGSGQLLQMLQED